VWDAWPAALQVGRPPSAASIADCGPNAAPGSKPTTFGPLLLACPPTLLARLLSGPRNRTISPSPDQNDRARAAVLFWPVIPTSNACLRRSIAFRLRLQSGAFQPLSSRTRTSPSGRKPEIQTESSSRLEQAWSGAGNRIGCRAEPGRGSSRLGPLEAPKDDCRDCRR
jgi:hypothetical protein